MKNYYTARPCVLPKNKYAKRGIKRLLSHVPVEIRDSEGKLPVLELTHYRREDDTMQLTLQAPTSPLEIIAQQQCKIYEHNGQYLCKYQNPLDPLDRTWYLTIKPAS